MHPFGNSVCAATFSLFDTVALTQQTQGLNNKVSNGSTFFVDRASKDFHLDAVSIAKGAADPNQILDVDFDGNQRPNPAGTPPDMGAFEAP